MFQQTLYNILDCKVTATFTKIQAKTRSDLWANIVNIHEVCYYDSEQTNERTNERTNKRTSEHTNKHRASIMLCNNAPQSIMKKIKKRLQKFKEEATKAEKEYIHKLSWKTSNFYGLPKIHKSKCINEAINEQDAEHIKLQAPNDLKFRPIVAGPLSPTHRLSNFVGNKRVSGTLFK